MGRTARSLAAAALTVVSILVLGGEVYPVLQQHGADGGQVLLGSQMQRCLPMFGQLIYFSSGQQLKAETQPLKCAEHLIYFRTND